MGRPKKIQSIEDQINEEAGLDVSRETTAVLDMPKIKETKKEILKANEFTDEYTLKVDSDFDPSADLFRVPNKSPDYAYRYLRDDAERISITTTTLLHQKGGWQLVPKSHNLKIGFTDRDLSEDGFRRIGKHILAFMPISLYNKKVAGKQDKTKMRTAGIKRLVGDGIEVIGGNGASRRKRDKSQMDNEYETPQ